MEAKFLVIAFSIVFISLQLCESHTDALELDNLPKARERRGLWDLLSKKVVQAQLYARKSRKGKGYDHYGVVITTKGGGRWLVHKGHNFSKSSDTAITKATHMSKRWDLIKTKKVKNVDVAIFLATGGRYFHPIHDNAYHAAKRMMKLGQ